MTKNDEEYFDDTDWDMEESHGYDCDCDECTFERDSLDCGLLPDHLGGGCTMSGTEFCDFDCPIRRLQEDEDE